MRIQDVRIMLVAFIASTILLEGIHTSEEMIEALTEHFPQVLDNLTKAGVKLVEIKKLPEEHAP